MTDDVLLIGIFFESIKDMRSRKSMKHNAWILGLGSHRDGKALFRLYDLHEWPRYICTYRASDIFDNLSINIDGHNETYSTS